MNDLTTPWVASQAFLQGKNPYTDMGELQSVWSAADPHLPNMYRNYSGVLASRPMAYPPTTLELIAPLGFFHWHTAAWLYLIGSTSLFVFGIVLLAQNLAFSWRDPRLLYFVSFALAMAPLHMGSQMDNLNTLTAACLCVSIGLLSRKPYWSGFALAVAICLKPQVAIFFFAYVWLRKKWKVALTALAASALIIVSSVLWMEVHQIPWFSSFLGALSGFSAAGSTNSVFTPGIGRFELLNLQVLAYQFTHNREWTGILSWTIFAVLAGVSFFLIGSRISDRYESTGIAIISILTLLPTYQRFYTAEILLFVVYWAVENWRSRVAKISLVVLLPLLVALVPWLRAYQGFPQRLASTRAPITVRIAISCWSYIRTHPSSLLLKEVILPYVIWIELFLCAVLLFTLRNTCPAQDRTSGC